jgi:hypothetical protein
MEIKRTKGILTRKRQGKQGIAQHECVTEQRRMSVVFKITSNLIKLRKMQGRY